MIRIKKQWSKFWALVKNYQLLSIFILAALIGLGLDIAGLHNHGLRGWAHIILAVANGIVAFVIAWRMIDKLRFGAWGIDILALTAIVAGVVLKEYWAATITVIMFLGGEALEVYAENRATVDLGNLFKKAPQTATVLRGRRTLEVAAADVHAGDKLLINPGEIVPVDCIIIEGQSSFDESSLTGEAEPADKKVGDDLLSGSINFEGAVTARALRAAEDSQYEQIIKLVKSASTNQAPFVKMADRFAVPFSIMSFVIAGAVWVASGDAKRFLDVLVVATPCPLLLGAPVGMISGMSKAAKRGIIIKRGSVLEIMASLKSLAFDKTGTLTKGQPEVSEVISFSRQWSKDKVVALAAGVELRSSHLLADALQTYARVKKIKPVGIRGTEEHPGKGLSGLWGRQVVLVGRLSYMKEQGIKIPKEATSSKHETISYVAVDGSLVGSIGFVDQLRNNSKDVLANIHAAGIKNTIMVSGDDQKTADRIAKELGITTVYAEQLPAGKVEVIESIDEKDRPVGFVGDGVNDAPVLAVADIGIALGARGSTAASDSADAVILQDNLAKAVEAIQIAKRTMRITKQTILAGIGMSVVLMAIFATGKFRASYGAAVQELVDVTVILNALRARR